MIVLDQLNALSKVVLGLGIIDAGKYASQTKIAYQKAEELAQYKYLREAVAMVEKTILLWSKKPGFWERWICQILLGDTLDKLKQQLLSWRQQVAQADKLLVHAKIILQKDTGDPLETEAIDQAIAIYQQCSKILYDQRVLLAIQQYQQELQQRQQFQTLVTQGDSFAKSLYFKKAIAIYQEADKLYHTKFIADAIVLLQSQVSHEEMYDSAWEQAQQAESEGRLRGAIAILSSTLTNFPRSEGINFLNKLKSIVQGKEFFAEGLLAEKAGDFPNAMVFYENAKPLLPDITNCCIRLGVVAIKSKDWTTAISHLNGIPGEQATYLRGFAYAQQDNLQLAYREWQKLSTREDIARQLEIIHALSQRQRLLYIEDIEQLVKTENLDLAKTVSMEFLKKFAFDQLVETNLNQHIQPRLEAAVWQSSDWESVANQTEKNWIDQPSINTLHNWTVASYYLAQNNSKKLFNLIISLPTALANLTADSTLQDVPWLGNKKIDFHAVFLNLKSQLEIAIEQVKNINIADYLYLRDRSRLDLVALKLIKDTSSLGMQVNDIIITPGCYNYFYSQWQYIIVDNIRSNQKILRSLYTPWGLAVAACLEGDSPRAIQIKPLNQAHTEIEKFAEKFVAYYQGCYQIQEQKWREAVIYLKLAKSEIENNQNWQKEIDKVFGLHRQTISEFQEHLEFAEFWYEILDSQLARSYLAEYQAESLRQEFMNKQISLKKTLEKLEEVQAIDESNPVVIDLIEKLELTQELEVIDLLLKSRQFEAAVTKARRSQRKRVRYIVADFFIDILVNGVKRGDLNDPNTIKQLGRWAYEICPDEPEFQEVYRSLKIRW